jgi:hypothetical protein
VEEEESEEIRVKSGRSKRERKCGIRGRLLTTAHEKI